MRLGNAPPMNLVIVFLGAALVVFCAGVSAVLATGNQAPTELWAAGGAISGALVGLLVPTPGQTSASSAASVVAADSAHTAAVTAAEQAAKQASDRDPGTATAAKEAVDSVRNLLEQVHASSALLAKGREPADAAVAATRTAQHLYQALATDTTMEAQRAEAQVAALENPGPGQSVDENAVAAAKRTADRAQVKLDVQTAATHQVAAGTPSAVKAGLTAASKAKQSGTRTVWLLAAIFVLFLAIGIVLSAIPSESDQTLKDASRTVLALTSSAGGALVGLFAPQSGGAGGT